jgi:hypothetical protein
VVAEEKDRVLVMEQVPALVVLAVEAAVVVMVAAEEVVAAVEEAAVVENTRPNKNSINQFDE